MKQDVNYIIHHTQVNLKICELELNPTHVSLYNALFLIWNNCGYDTELSINRNDVMKLSKIGSANTYTKCMKELDRLELIKYKPSYNPLIGSKINMYRFDKGTDKGTDKGCVKGSSKGTDNSSATLSKQLNNKTIKLLLSNYDLVNNKLDYWIKEDKKSANSDEAPKTKYNIIEPEYLGRYLVMFNALKEKLVNQKSSKTIDNKKLVEAWNKFMDNINVDDLIPIYIPDIRKAIEASCKSDWHRDNKYKSITPEFFLRTDKREYWVDIYNSEHSEKVSRKYDVKELLFHKVVDK